MLKEEIRLMVFERWVVRRIFGPKRYEFLRGGEDYRTRNLMICAPHNILFG
jgi:hypothetical protein